MNILAPVRTEKAIKRIEDQKTITFEVHIHATKDSVAKEVEKIFNVKVSSVNVSITSKGVKHAMVKLDKAYKADDIAAKLKMVA